MYGFADFRKILVDFFGFLARCTGIFGVIHPSVVAKGVRDFFSEIPHCDMPQAKCE